jgi:hypothetical protein
MAEVFSKEEFERLINVPGEVRGMGIKAHADFVLKKEGQEALERLEKTIADLGYPIHYNDLKAMDFYPLGLEVVTLVAIKRLFGYDDEKLQEMGGFGVKSSFLMRLFMKYFVSFERLVKEAPKMWKRGGAVGDFKVVDYDKDKRFLILRIENFKVHPIYCSIFKGYFLSALQMILKDKPTCQETKCSFSGDEYHQFLLKW